MKYPLTTYQLWMKGEEPNEEPEMHMVQVPASPKRSGDQQVELPDTRAQQPTTSRAVEVHCYDRPGLLMIGRL
jgi:hypothetical protein